MEPKGHPQNVCKMFIVNLSLMQKKTGWRFHMLLTALYYQKTYLIHNLTYLLSSG